MQQNPDDKGMPGIHHVTAIATDPPRFTLDERVEASGQSLRLPPWLESRRGEIQQALPRIELPRVAV